MSQMLSSRPGDSPADTRLLICSPGIPHESRGASTVLFYHYIDRLKREGFQVLNLLLLEPGNFTEEGLAEYTARMATARFAVVPCQADRLLRSGFLRYQPDPALVAEVRQRAAAFQPDILFALDFLSAWAVGPVAVRARVVWLGDLNFQTRWYHAWYAAKEQPWQAVRLPFAWNRARMWKRLYRQVLRPFDSVIVSSKSSEGHLARLGIDSFYLPYPWPDVPTAEGGAQVERHDLPSFLFFGSLGGLGSRSAFHFMVNRLYPLLVAMWGREGFQVFIAGMRQPPDWVAAALARRPEFKFLGFVDDLDSLMAGCHAVLAPIDVPVGNRSRIVTALAKGALVIAHQNTALGNPDLVDGETCYLVRDAGQFAARMREAFENPALSATLAANARACYARRFAPEVAADLLVKAIWRVYNRDSAGHRPDAFSSGS